MQRSEILATSFSDDCKKNGFLVKPSPVSQWMQKVRQVYIMEQLTGQLGSLIKGYDVFLSVKF